MPLARLLIAAALLAAAPVHAQDFYRGKTINFVVSADAGNSYDTFARMLARHLPKYIPGEPQIIIQDRKSTRLNSSH